VHPRRACRTSRGGDRAGAQTPGRGPPRPADASAGLAARRRMSRSVTLHLHIWLMQSQCVPAIRQAVIFRVGSGSELGGPPPFGLGSGSLHHEEVTRHPPHRPRGNPSGLVAPVATFPARTRGTDTHLRGRRWMTALRDR
jgi:hypothetical protein